MNKQAVIMVHNLQKKYGNRTVLDIPAWQVVKGRITGIIGPSGAGKSTLLRILNLLEQPTKGDILFFGHDVPAKRMDKLELQRRMTMVFQKPVLLDQTVFDNIAYGLRARGFAQHEINKRVEEALDKVGLTNQSRQRAKTLSGGEAQRVAFARASVLQPDILLLDEATANLDPANVELLEKMILCLREQTKTTILMVTHNLFQAKRLADDVAFFNQGRLVEAGSAAELFASPQQEETKAFVEGRMIY